MSDNDPRYLRNVQLDVVLEHLKLALQYAKECDEEDKDDLRIREWIEGTLEEFGDDVEDYLDLDTMMD